MVLKDSRLSDNLLVVRHLLIHVTGKSWQVRDRTSFHCRATHTRPTLTQTGTVYMRQLTLTSSWDVGGNWRKSTLTYRECADPTQTVAPGRNLYFLLLINVIMKGWTKWHYSRTCCIWDSKLIYMKHMTQDKEVECLFAYSNHTRIRCGMLWCQMKNI